VLSDLPLPPPPQPVDFEQPLSNQIRGLVGYGSESRKGFNLITGLGYDFENKTLQNQIVQLSYNGGCCGLAIEYRRINLGQVRARISSASRSSSRTLATSGISVTRKESSSCAMVQHLAAPVPTQPESGYLRL